MSAQLSQTMRDALLNCQLDPDWELHVGWTKYVPERTLSALRRRGLTNQKNQLTQAGKDWFNANAQEEPMSRNPGDNRPGTGPGNGGGRGGNDRNRHDAGTSGNRDNTPGRQGTDAEPKEKPKE